MKTIFLLLATVCPALCETPDPPPIVTPDPPRLTLTVVPTVDEPLLPPIGQNKPNKPGLFAATLPNHHWHQRTDGSYYQHHDANHGVASAHVGVDFPWRKVAAPSTVSTITAATSYVESTAKTGQAVDAQCPDGRCPVPTQAAPLFPRLRGLFR